MAVQAKNGVPSKTGASIKDEIAACLFYLDKGVKTQFETASAEVMADYRNKSAAVLAHLSKMDLTLANVKVSAEAEKAGKKSLEAVTLIIKKFVSGLKTTKPALFPSEELAHKILE